MNFDRQALYKHIGCAGSDLNVVSYDATAGQTYGLQAKVDKIADYFEKHRPYAVSPDHLLYRVKQEWTAGLGPVASWFLWLGIRTLAKKVVFWLWKHYNSQN